MRFLDLCKERGVKRAIRIYAEAIWNLIVNRYGFQPFSLEVK